MEMMAPNINKKRIRVPEKVSRGNADRFWTMGGGVGDVVHSIAAGSRIEESASARYEGCGGMGREITYEKGWKWSPIERQTGQKKERVYILSLSIDERTKTPEKKEIKITLSLGEEKREEREKR